ncbi:putative membrane protein YccC [Paraburkholderia sp. GAS41]|uniref:FUSC family protein n=1 Tax=Paraburkholderia sp. GAS41 TaxID=3035134 RepID=UPI003D19D538
MIAVAFSRVAGRLLVADPGLVRLHTALRVTLACLLSAVACVSWTAGHREPITVAALGVLFSMIAPLFVRDARRSAWFVTLFYLYLSGCMNFAVAAALSHYPLAGDAAFLLVMFTGMLCQACGPRALGCAMLGVVTFYLGLYLHPTVVEATQSVALSVTGPVMVALVGRLIVPMRAARTLRLAVHTVTLRAQRVLAATRAGQAPSVATATRVSELNEAALALEEQLALLNPTDAATLRERLVELEVAAGHTTFGAAPVAATMDPLRRAIERLKRAAKLQRVSHTRCAARSKQNAAEWLADIRARLAWLPAARATTAALLAMVIGHSLSPERWFWAVITTFVVFLGTRSRADTVYRGAQRLAGTLAGALASMLLASALHDAPLLMIAAMAVCVFGWAYYILSAYAPGVFFITVLVGLVYGQLGFAMGPLIQLRIEEVMVGCSVSFAVAILMMPLAATHHVEARITAVLAALRQVVRLATQPGTSPRDPAAASAAMRVLDRSWHDLRIALRPLQTQRVFVWNPAVELATGSLLSCLHWARVLCRQNALDATQGLANNDAASHDAGAGAGAAHAASILARLDAMIARYNGDAASVLADEHFASAHSAARVMAYPGDAQTLAQLEGAVAQLADRLAQPDASMQKRLNWALRTRST